MKNYWLDFVESCGEEGLVKILVGNKMDVAEKVRAVNIQVLMIAKVSTLGASKPPSTQAPEPQPPEPPSPRTPNPQAPEDPKPNPPLYPVGHAPSPQPPSSRAPNTKLPSPLAPEFRASELPYYFWKQNVVVQFARNLQTKIITLDII